MDMEDICEKGPRLVVLIREGFYPRRILAFRISVRWPIYIINSVDKSKFLYTYPRRLENLTICECNYKGSTFPSIILRPHDLPHGSPVLKQLSHRCAVAPVIPVTIHQSSGQLRITQMELNVCKPFANLTIS